MRFVSPRLGVYRELGRDKRHVLVGSTVLSRRRLPSPYRSPQNLIEPANVLDYFSEVALGVLGICVCEVVLWWRKIYH